MRFEILLGPEAVEDLRRLKAGERTVIKEALETHLRHEPTKTSRSRIKRLRGIARPQFRLRVEEVRVFYDVSGATVEGLSIVPKPGAESWLGRFGSPKGKKRPFPRSTTPCLAFFRKPPPHTAPSPCTA